MIDLLSFLLGVLTSCAVWAVLIMIAIINDKRDEEANQTKSSFEAGKP